MAFNHQVTTKTDGLFVSLGNSTSGYRLAGIKDIGELAMTGTATQIDTTGYLGHSKTYAQGKLDPGQIQATANAAPHSPLYNFLENAQKDATEHTFSVVMGHVEDTGLTEGAPRSVVDGLSVTVASKVVTLPATTAQNMPGISLGDFILPYAASSPPAAGTYTDAREITGIERQGNGSVEVTHGGNAVTGTLTRANILRPAVIMQIQVLVMKVSYRFPPDGVAEATIEMQATGEGTRTPGTPAVSFTTYNLPAA